jgi:hypothetical protein
MGENSLYSVTSGVTTVPYHWHNCKRYSEPEIKKLIKIVEEHDYRKHLNVPHLFSLYRQKITDAGETNVQYASYLALKRIVVILVKMEELTKV